MPVFVHAIDLSAYHARLALLSRAALGQAVADIGEAARHKWARLAQAGLHTTLADYLLGLRPVAVEGLTATIALTGELPNLIEQGMDQKDLRATLLGPKVPVVPRGERGKHLSRAGFYYRSIAFRHATPGSAGLVAPPMGSRFATVPGFGLEKSRELGKAIYERARRLQVSTTGFPPAAALGAAGRIPGAALGAGFGRAGRRWGERLSDEVAARLAPVLANRVTGIPHAASIYAGMYRMRPPGSTTGHYVTFRTISTSPAAKGKWIRPRTPGKKYAEQVAREIGPMARQILVGLLKGAA